MKLSHFVVGAQLVSLLACSGGTELASTGGAGGTSGASGASATELIDKLCDSLSALQCDTARPKEDCVRDQQTELAKAEERGCAALLEPYLACAASHPPVCGGWTEEPSHPVASYDCSKGREYDECVLGDMIDCAVFGCSVRCPQGSARCDEADGGGTSVCVCDTGPHTGESYSAVACGQDMVEQMVAHCF